MAKKKKDVAKPGWKTTMANGHVRHRSHRLRAKAAGKVLGVK